MTKTTETETHEPIEHDAEEPRPSRAKGKPASATLPQGGMSPLADRKEPDAWSRPGCVVPATGISCAPTRNDERRVTPSEPIGGWVNASTGRGKILVPAEDAAKVALGRITHEETLELEHSAEDAVADEAELSEESETSTEGDEEGERDAKALAGSDDEADD